MTVSEYYNILTEVGAQYVMTNHETPTNTMRTPWKAVSLESKEEKGQNRIALVAENEIVMESWLNFSQ